MRTKFPFYLLNFKWEIIQIQKRLINTQNNILTPNPILILLDDFIEFMCHKKKGIFTKKKMCLYIFICCTREWFYGVMWTFECMHVLKKKKKTIVKHERSEWKASVKKRQLWIKVVKCNISCVVFYIHVLYIKQGSWRLKMALFKLTYLVERTLDPLCGSIFSYNTRIPSVSKSRKLRVFRWSRSY